MSNKDRHDKVQRYTHDRARSPRDVLAAEQKAAMDSLRNRDEETPVSSETPEENTSETVSEESKSEVKVNRGDDIFRRRPILGHRILTPIRDEAKEEKIKPLYDIDPLRSI